MAETVIATTESLVCHLAEAEGDSDSAPRCALDTEADSLHRYRESLCLIQFATADLSVLIDPLAVADLSPLGEYLARSVVWMHGADYDMTMLKRQFGTLPAAIFDTQIGARLLGARKFGLADLVREYFGVELSKSSQKADWGKRPLSPKMMEYALNDVRYLLPMGDTITAKLESVGRFEWFEESCLAARQRVLERDDSRAEVWRVQGSGKLDRQGLACLRTLWQWRDEEAKEWDRPSFMVATNRQLLEWSFDLSEGRSVVPPSHFRSERIKRLREAIATATGLPEEQWPARPKTLRRKRERDFERKVDALISLRDRVAAELDIEGSLLAPRATLESLAAGEVEPHEVLLNWQRKCLEFD
jgi:ribonuclease D